MGPAALNAPRGRRAGSGLLPGPVVLVIDWFKRSQPRLILTAGNADGHTVRNKGFIREADSPPLTCRLRTALAPELDRWSPTSAAASAALEAMARREIPDSGVCRDRC